MTTRWTRGARIMAISAALATAGTALTVPSASAAGQAQIYAHRGGSYDAPESTLAAFGQALGAGVRGIEFDVKFTKDGVPVIFHDTRLNRTTNCSGQVSNITYPKLRRCDAGSWFDSAFRGQRVPTLRETLSFITSQSATTKIWVHVKSPSRSEARAIMAELHRHGVANDRTTVLGSSPAELSTMARAGAGRLGYVFSDSSGWNSRYEVLIPYQVRLSESLVAAAKRRGQQVFVVEDKSYSLDEALSYGVTGMLADDVLGALGDYGKGSSGGGSGGGAGGGGAS